MMTKKQHIASWLLLAVFLPMLVFSSLHVHEEHSVTTEIACADCVHHSCHGHLTQTASWAHDCVLCQFLTLTFIAGIAGAVVFISPVCRTLHAQALCGHYSGGYGVIVTRGPPAIRE